MIYARASLDGELFLIKINDEEGEADGGTTYYPLSFLHESSGLRREDMTTEFTQPSEVLADYGFAEDLVEFYRRLYGRAPADPIIRDFPVPEGEKR
jgi:hypothetical protein